MRLAMNAASFSSWVSPGPRGADSSPPDVTGSWPRHSALGSRKAQFGPFPPAGARRCWRPRWAKMSMDQFAAVVSPADASRRSRCPGLKGAEFPNRVTYQLAPAARRFQGWPPPRSFPSPQMVWAPLVDVSARTSPPAAARHCAQSSSSEISRVTGLAVPELPDRRKQQGPSPAPWLFCSTLDWPPPHCLQGSRRGHGVPLKLA